MYIKEVSSVGFEPHKSGKLVFSCYNLSLNVVLGGSTTQLGNFVKAIKFVSGITESKELKEEGITSVEAEIGFDNSDTSGRSAGNRRSHLVTVKRQLFEDGTDGYNIDNSRAQKSRVDELLSSLKRSLQYAYLTEGKSVDMSPEELLSMFTEMTEARERKQFSMRLSYVMTVNKAQGETIPNAGVYFSDSVVSHSQLYVALYTRISCRTTKILVKPVKEFGYKGFYLSNVAYQEVLRDD
nr:hypothetical protein [Tanacetum cinerariifolium]